MFGLDSMVLLGLLYKVRTNRHNLMAQLFHTAKLVLGTWAQESDLLQVLGRSDLTATASWPRNLQTYNKACCGVSTCGRLLLCAPQPHALLRAGTNVASHLVMSYATVTVTYRCLYCGCSLEGTGDVLETCVSR